MFALWDWKMDPDCSKRPFWNLKGNGQCQLHKLFVRKATCLWDEAVFVCEGVTCSRFGKRSPVFGLIDRLQETSTSTPGSLVFCLVHGILSGFTQNAHYTVSSQKCIYVVSPHVEFHFSRKWAFAWRTYGSKGINCSNEHEHLCVLDGTGTCHMHRLKQLN